MTTKQQKILVGVTIGTIIALIAAGVIIFTQKKKITEVTNDRDDMLELLTIEKEELEEQYEDLYIQFDGYQEMDIRNDSLQDLLSREQQRVQDLLEELKSTKASNAKKIKELKDQLAAVQAVTHDLIRQIDSLNITNARLVEENEAIKLENTLVKNENKELSTINSQLTETVSRASMLQISSLSMTMLNKNDKKTRMVSHMVKLQFDYEIEKNITCKPGIKELYARITDPEGNILGESEDKLFHFENLDIAYSLSQQFEFTGEDYQSACYYKFAENEEVKKGFYTIDFFCDDNLIGSFPFELKK